MKGALEREQLGRPLGWGGRRAKNEIEVLRGKRGVEASAENPPRSAET